MIAKCDCKHEFQDSTYGKNNRIHNQKGKVMEVCCTVCGKTNKTKEEIAIKKEKK